MEEITAATYLQGLSHLKARLLATTTQGGKTHSSHHPVGTGKAKEKNKNTSMICFVTELEIIIQESGYMRHLFITFICCPSCIKMTALKH